MDIPPHFFQSFPPNYAASITSCTKTKFVGCTRGRSLFKQYILASMIEEFLALSHSAGQPKITCPSTITSGSNKEQSGGNTMSSASILPLPSSTSHRTTHSPTHTLPPIQTITRKSTKIPSQCAPAKVLSNMCVSSPNMICMDNPQDKAMVPSVEKHVHFPVPSKEPPPNTSLPSVPQKDSIPDHLSIKDERETVSCVPSSLIRSSMLDKSCSGRKNQNVHGRGDVMFGVAFKEGELVVHLCKCRGLEATKTKGYYIKTYLLPDKTKQSKKKTDLKRKTINPEYNAFMKVHLQDEDTQHAHRPPTKSNLPHQPADHKKVMRRRTRAPNRLRCANFLPGQEYTQLIGERDGF